MGKNDQKNQKRLGKIAKHIQRINPRKVCFDDFLDALDETIITQTRETLDALLRFVDERIEDIKMEQRCEQREPQSTPRIIE